MRSLFASIATLALLGAAPAFADHYEFDKPHTNIVFHVNHLGFSDMIGRFSAFDGSFEFDESMPEKSSVDVTIDPAGIRTSSEALDKHLQSDQFFNTAKFPNIHFVSTAIKVTGERTGDITGNMTMLGVTKPVTLHVHFNKADYHPMTKMYTAGFSAEGTLKRSDFGMNTYIPMVGDEVRFEIQTEGTDMNRKKAEEIKH